MYLIFAPVFGLIMFLFFNKRAIQKKWWLYRHPQTVYKCTFFHPNKMYSERFVHSTKETFEYEGGTYNIKKEAIIRKNWYGVRGNRTFTISEENTIDFEKYKLWVDGHFEELPNTAQMIGELHFVFDFPDPIVYADAEDLIKQELDKKPLGIIGSKLVAPLRTAGEQNRVEKNSVLDQLITAEFKQITMMIIVVLVVLVLLGVAYLLLLRLEIVDTPLHAVCVNIAQGVANAGK